MAKEFTTTLKEEEVTIDGKMYTVRELDGKGLAVTRRIMSSAEVTVNADGTSSFKGVNLEGQELDLLCLCLYDEQGKLVTKEVMVKWPSTVLTGLYNIAQELSGLNEKAREKLQAEAKNS